MEWHLDRLCLLPTEKIDERRTGPQANVDDHERRNLSRGAAEVGGEEEEEEKETRVVGAAAAKQAEEAAAA